MAEQHLLLEVFSTPPRSRNQSRSPSNVVTTALHQSKSRLDKTRRTQSLPSSPRGLGGEECSVSGESSSQRRRQLGGMLFSVEELALATWDSPIVAALTTPIRRSAAAERQAKDSSANWSRSNSQSSGEASSQRTPPRSSRHTQFEHDTTASSASSTPERNNRTFAKPGKNGTAPILSLESEGSVRASIAPRLTAADQTPSTTWGTTILNFTSNYISPASSREESLTRTGSQSDQLSDSDQYLNLQELAKELRYGDPYSDNVEQLPLNEEEKKELDLDDGSRMPLEQAWYKYYQQQQQLQQPDPPEEIPPTPSEIASSVESDSCYDAKAPDPPSAFQRESSAASSSALSSKSAVSISSSAKKLQSPFAFMMSRSAEDILNVTAEELEMAHYMGKGEDAVEGQDEQKNDDANLLRTPKSSSTENYVETTPALLAQPPHAASPGPSPPSLFPSASQRLNKQRLAVANAMETIAASASGAKGASPNRRMKQLPPIGRLATPPPPPPGQPTPPPKPQGAAQSNGTPGSSALPQQPSKSTVPSPPSSTRATRQDGTTGAASSVSSRAMTPIMRIRLGIEEPATEVPVHAQQLQSAKPDWDSTSERVVSPSGTLQTQTTSRTEVTDGQTNTSVEESEYYQQQRRWRRKTRMAENIRRKLARSQGRRSDRGSRGRDGTSSARSAASSTLGRSIDDDESSFYSTADLSCQNILSRLIRARCGNLDDSASMYENSESEDEDYDESVTSTLYSEAKKTKGGRIVSFDDESDDRDARQQKILMLKQKKQQKETSRVSDVVRDDEQVDMPQEMADSMDNRKPEDRSTMSASVAKDGPKSSSPGSMTRNGKERNRLDDAASQLSIQSPSATETTLRWKKGKMQETDEESVPSHDVQEDSLQQSELEKGVDESCTTMSSQSVDERDSPMSNDDGSWHDVGSTRSRESRVAFKQDWDVYGDSNGVEVDVHQNEEKADSDVKEVIRLILKPTNQGDSAGLNDIDMHDRNFIKTFVTLATTSGIPLLYHSAAKKLVSLPAPTRVTLRIRLGSESSTGDFQEPQLTWTTAEGRRVGSVDLFDIESLDRASTVELRSYPLALPSKSLVLRTEGGDQYIFEALDEGVAYRLVHGMRWIVARLAFNLIIGNLNVSCELLDVEGDVGVAPEPLEKQLLAKAMNDVTNHLVNKSVQA